MVTEIWVNIGSGSCLLPDSTKPLPEPNASHHLSHGGFCCTSFWVERAISDPSSFMHKGEQGEKEVLQWMTCCAEYNIVTLSGALGDVTMHLMHLFFDLKSGYYTQRCLQGNNHLKLQKTFAWRQSVRHAPLAFWDLLIDAKWWHAKKPYLRVMVT